MTLSDVLWVINYEGPTLQEDGWTHFRNPPKARLVEADDVLAAVRSLIAENGVGWLLDGLEEAEKVEALYQLGPDGRFVWRAELPKSGTYYVVPVDPGGTE